MIVGQSTPVSIPQSTTDGGPVVAGKINRRIRVFAVSLNGPTTTSVTFNDKPTGAGVAVSPAYQMPAGGLELEYNPNGWFDVATAGDALTVTTGAGGAVSIQITYGYLQSPYGV